MSLERKVIVAVVAVILIIISGFAVNIIGILHSYTSLADLDIYEKEYAVRYAVAEAEAEAEANRRMRIVQKANLLNAYVMAQEFVKDRLKSPATAKWPGNFIEDTEYLGNDTHYKITSCVDAQNSFGAFLRSYFVCVIRMNEYTCSLISLDFNEY